jgi:CDGSH-type Zn-finger protein
MDEPKCAGKAPAKVELEAGKKYAYCTCGLSANQPFCDGAHKGTDFTPIVFEADETKTAFICQCKRTGNAPHCDGTHNKLDDSDGPQAKPITA